MEETNEAIVQKRRGKLPLILGIALAVLLVGYGALCATAALTHTIYPNRTMRDIDVGGLTVDQAAEKLAREFPSQSFTLRPYTETEELEPLTLSYGDLGASLNATTAARIAHKDFNTGNFFSNGLDYLQCLLGLNRTDSWCDLDIDEAAFAAGLARLEARLSRPAQDAAFTLGTDSITVTTALDGQRIIPRQGDSSFEDVLRRHLTVGRSADVKVELLPAKPLTAQEIFDAVSGEMKNAGYDAQTQSITAEQVGADFDVARAQQLLDAAAPGDTVKFDAQIEYPSVTAKELEQVLFRDVLGTYTTHVGGSAGRIGNVRLSAEKVNEFVLNAGEIFSYNEVVGERTAANGYQPAPAYVKGETVDEIGGGICQTSSTVYMAALLSNLEIVERYAHRYVPAYIPWGMDATVSWGGPEFRFRNNTDYPVKLVAGVSKKNYLTITVYGTKTDDVTVKMTNQTISTTPYETVRQEDLTLAPGTQMVKVTPYTGYKVEAYRNLYDGNGKLLSSTLESVSNYKVRNQLILVGPTPVVPEVPAQAPADLPAGGGAEVPVTPPPQTPEEPALPEEPAEPPAA